VTAILAAEDEPALTEDQKRAGKEREKEYQRKEDEYIAQQKVRVLEGEERKRKATETGGWRPSVHLSSSPAPPPPPPSYGNHFVFTLSGNMSKDYMGKAYTVR
jgi:hypothetical protein